MFADNLGLSWLKKTLRKDVLRKADYVNKETRKFLSANHWELSTPKGFAIYLDFTARRQSNVLAVLCSGTNRRLKKTQISDLRYKVQEWGYHPVFIYGEEFDPQLYSSIWPESEILLAFQNLPALDDAIGSLKPTIRGAVDRLILPRRIMGWARLSPYGKATIRAWIHGEMVSEAEATDYRQSLSSSGDGKYGFELKLPVNMSADEIINTVVIKSYYNNNKFIKSLPYWSGLVAS